MKHHLNTLFVMTQGAYLKKDGETIVVRVEKKDRLRLPMLNVGGIVCLGRISCSPQLLGACAQNGIAVSFMTQNGRFLAAVNGFTSGNVLLRREQYRRADDPAATAAIARACIIGKLSNYRTVLRRAVRDQSASDATARLEKIATRIDMRLRTLQTEFDVDQLRGVEGDASADYFEVFNDLITSQKEDFLFTKRTRRPPLDNVNAMLSFLYSMLTIDLRSACESAGLDAAVGFLHRDRPGRPGLALDLMEELRPVLVDRVVLSLINRQQVKPSGFVEEPGGGIRMDEATRKELVGAYQKRKQEEITHPFLEEKMTLGLVPLIQARLDGPFPSRRRRCLSSIFVEIMSPSRSAVMKPIRADIAICKRHSAHRNNTHADSCHLRCRNRRQSWPATPPKRGKEVPELRTTSPELCVRVLRQQ